MSNIRLDGFALFPEPAKEELHSTTKETIKEETPEPVSSGAPLEATATIDIWEQSTACKYSVLTLPDGRALRFSYDTNSNYGTPLDEVVKIANFFGYTCKINEPISNFADIQRDLYTKHLLTIL